MFGTGAARYRPITSAAQLWPGDIPRVFPSGRVMLGMRCWSVSDLWGYHGRLGQPCLRRMIPSHRPAAPRTRLHHRPLAHVPVGAPVQVRLAGHPRRPRGHREKRNENHGVPGGGLGGGVGWEGALREGALSPSLTGFAAVCMQSCGRNARCQRYGMTRASRPAALRPEFLSPPWARERSLGGTRVGAGKGFLLIGAIDTTRGTPR